MVRPGARLRLAGLAALVVGVVVLGATQLSKPALSVTFLPETTRASSMAGRTSSISIHYNQRYGPGPLEVLDTYRSTSARGWRPAVLLVHGGGWHTGSKNGWRKVADQLADAGFVAVAVNYDLTSPTSNGFPRQLDELRAAIRWLRDNAPAYGIDGRHIGALGSSAGGNLVAMLATDAHGPLDSGSRLGAAVTWSAILDLANQPGLTTDIPTYVGCHVNCRSVLDAASPLHHVSGGGTPIEMFNSTHELVPLTSVKAMDAKLTAAQVVHTTVIYDGTTHGTGYADTATPTSIAFLQQHLG